MPEALIPNREREVKEEPIQRTDKINTRPRKKCNNNRHCRFCNAPNWSPTHKCRAIDQTCNNYGKNGHFARTCRQRENSKIGKKSEETELRKYRIERTNRIADKNKNLTTTVKINRTEKKFVIDTGSPISQMWITK